MNIPAKIEKLTLLKRLLSLKSSTNNPYPSSTTKGYLPEDTNGFVGKHFGKTDIRNNLRLLRPKRVRLLMSFGILLIVGVVFYPQIQNAFAMSTWSQGDWSGGVGVSDTTQFSSISGVDATSVSSQVSLVPVNDWFDSDWSYREKITIDHTKVDANLMDFPVDLNLSNLSSNFFSKVKNDGSDIRITKSDGKSQTAIEVTSVDSVDHTGEVYFKADLSSSVDTSFYIYYGNTSAVTPGKSSTFGSQNVWSNGYSSVWPFGINAQDSTTSGYDGTAHGVVSAPDRHGAEQGAYDFDGTSGYVDMGDVHNMGTDDLTFSLWFKTTSSSSGLQGLLGKSLYGAQSGRYFLILNNGDLLANIVPSGSAVSTSTPQAPYVDGDWHQAVVAYDRDGSESLYMDGVLVDSASISSYAGTNLHTTDNLLVGAYNNNTGHGPHPGSYFKGAIDDVRLSLAVRSADWVSTAYKNQSSPVSFYSIGSVEGKYQTSGNLISSIHDSGASENWGNLSYAAATPTGTSVSIKVRSGNQPDLSDASSFSACSAVTSGNDVTGACAPDKTRYAQYKVVFSGDGAATPLLTSVSINYSPSDTTTPPTNASSILLSRSDGGASVAPNEWINSYPYMSWTAGSDEFGGSGIKGYCLYLGQDSSANPKTTKGNLGVSPVDTDGACQFAVSGNSVDLATSGYIGTALTSLNTPYYLNVVAIDNANNVYNSGPAAQFQFRYDGTSPSNPAFVSAPSEFVSNKDVNLTWDTAGGSTSFDANSGVAGLQYRVGAGGTWYGDSHTGSQDATDLLSNDGSYTMQSSPDFANLHEGNNLVYFRTWDNAGNISQAYVTTVIKINTTSPSSPQNLSATPATNTTNSFGFSWLPPATYQGLVGNMTYCYTVNVLPNSSNCSFTPAGALNLPAGAYATEPGENTIYVVAKDEASNINYATYASTTFTANTPAPGVPLSLDIADISVKVNSIWKIALSWEKPSTTGAGIATYRVYRSVDGVNYTNIASTAGTSYVDTGLSQKLYYYQVKACDSANNCGALTPAVDMHPTGKFTDAAGLISGPNVVNSTRSASVSWTTNRDSDSSIAYGLSSNDYFVTEASSVSQTTSHTIVLNNLDAGTTYYYRAMWTDADGNTGTSVEGKFTTLPAPKISNVTITDVNLNEATVNFTTSGSSAVKLYYGPNGSFGNTRTLNTSNATSHYSVPLENLIDGTTYSYRINPIDVSGYEYTNPTSFDLTTPPAPHITNVQFQPVPGALTGTEEISWTTNVPTTSQISYGPQSKPLSSGTQAIKTKLTKTHKMTMDGLKYNTPYQIVATSQDSLGNITNSDIQVFRTGLDTRPPKISAVTVQPSIRGTGAGANGQIIVSWKTDKPGASQVAYGEGSGGDYSSKTAEDTNISTNHTVVISNLSTSQVYHIQAISKDKAGNVGVSKNQTTIIGQATDSALSVVFNALRSVFGL